MDYELDLGHVGVRHPKRSPGRGITGGGEKLRKEAEVGRARLVLEIKSGFSTLAAQDYVRILVSRHNADFDRRDLRQGWHWGLLNSAFDSPRQLRVELLGWMVTLGVDRWLREEAQSKET